MLVRGMFYSYIYNYNCEGYVILRDKYNQKHKFSIGTLRADLTTEAKESILAIFKNHMAVMQSVRGVNMSRQKFPFVITVKYLKFYFIRSFYTSIKFGIETCQL